MINNKITYHHLDYGTIEGHYIYGGKHTITIATCDKASIKIIK